MSANHLARLTANLALPAIAELISHPQWVCWRYKEITKADGTTKRTKPPVNPHVGGGASHSDPKTWGSFERALVFAMTRKLPGVGFVLAERDEFTDIDLDKCRDPSTGEIEPWACAILDLRETYAEVSPSGTGIRLIARGKVEHATKCDPAHVEIYGKQRYLTITGEHLPGAPTSIEPAPQTIAALIARAAEFQAAAEVAAHAAQPDATEPPKEPWNFFGGRDPRATPRAGAAKRKKPKRGKDFFRCVNDAAMESLSSWVLRLFPQAVHQPGTGGYRVSSDSLGRNLEEDISIVPGKTGGISDFGIHDMGDPRMGKRTPISLVQEWGGRADVKDAAHWLCDCMGAEPETLGWNEHGARVHAEEKADDGREWPEPRSLPDNLSPVPVFEDGFLPEALAAWASDIADRMQCPLDFIGVAALVAIGSLIGRKVAIRPQRKTDWMEVANLWGCIVGRPGAMKSPAMKEALKPLTRLEALARQKNEEALKEHQRAQEIYKIKSEADARRARKAFAEGRNFDDASFGDAPESPRMLRYVLNDTTYEALGLAMAHNPDGVLAFRDELVSLLKSLDDERNASARGFYLTGWNGTSGYTFDRILRGQTHIDAVCLSVLGSTQPGRLADYVRRSQGAGDDGLLQRFGLMVWPDQAPQFRNVDRYPDSDARQRAWAAFDRLNELTAASAGATVDQFDSIAYLRFDPGAQEMFDAWRLDLERRIRAGDLSPALESHLAKFRKLVPSLALSSHLANGAAGAVASGALRRAIAIADYAEAHARRCYAAGAQSEVTAAKAILSRIRNGDLEDGFTLRDVHQKDWSHLTDRDQVAGSLSLLVDFDWLAERTIRTGGRPRTVYTINPRAKT